MFEKLKGAIRRRRAPARMREEDEDRRRAAEELRQAELRKTQDHRGVEGV
jgi:hypothetical protein